PALFPLSLRDALPIYGGTVHISIEGVDIDALPPNPTFDHSRPVPVTVSIIPGPVFRLGSVRFEGDAAGRDPADYDLVPGGEAGSDRKSTRLNSSHVKI